MFHFSVSGIFRDKILSDISKRNTIFYMGVDAIPQTEGFMWERKQKQLSAEWQWWYNIIVWCSVRNEQCITNCYLCKIRHHITFMGNLRTWTLLLGFKTISASKCHRCWKLQLICCLAFFLFYSSCSFTFPSFFY